MTKNEQTETVEDLARAVKAHFPLRTSIKKKNEHYQSGCTWRDNEIEGYQLRHEHKRNQWHLWCIGANGVIESARISQATARILLAGGVAFGD